MENTWRCARCGHQNLPDAPECGRCKHSSEASERDFEAEVHDYRPSHSAVPWIIGAVTFALILIIGLLCRPNADAQNAKTPLFASLFSDEPPAELPPIPAANVLITSSPAHPGKAQGAQGEWRLWPSFKAQVFRAHKFFRCALLIGEFTGQQAQIVAAKANKNGIGFGADFKASVYRNPNEKVGVIANTAHQYKGILPMTGTGSFYFDISSPHVWAMRIEEWR